MDEFLNEKELFQNTNNMIKGRGEEKLLTCEENIGNLRNRSYFKHSQVFACVSGY